MKRQKTEPVSQPSQELRPDRMNSLYAVVRRLSVRLSQVEEDNSTLRRDLNAIRKKLYRSEEHEPPTESLVRKDGQWQFDPHTGMPVLR